MRSFSWLIVINLNNNFTFYLFILTRKQLNCVIICRMALVLMILVFQKYFFSDGYGVNKLGLRVETM